MLGQYFLAYKRWQDLDYQLAVSGKDVQSALSRENEEIGKKLMDLRDQYQSNLPVLPLSRCPFSSKVLYHSLDHYGIDGLWWNYEAPMRPVENVPATFHSITGALSLKTPIETAPFLCVPGPAVPYVIPEILKNEQISAVLSSVAIGRHQGYVITYFADNPSVPVPRVNSWGMDHWEVLDSRGTYLWDSNPVLMGMLDFQIDRWIGKGKLHWIEPGDQTVTLRQGATGCPYLSVPGSKEIQKIRNGALLGTGKKEGN